MLNYVIGTIVATLVLGAGWVGLEYNAGRQILNVRPLEQTAFEDLFKIAANERSDDREEAIIELGFRDDNLTRQVETLGFMAAQASPEVAQAAGIGIRELGDKVLPILEKSFAKPLEQQEDGTVTNRSEVFNSRVLGCTLIRVLRNEKCKKYAAEVKSLLDSKDSGLIRCGLFGLRGLPETAEECEGKLAELLIELPQRKPFDFNNQIAICQLIMDSDMRSAKTEKALQTTLIKGYPSVRGWAGVCLGEFVDSPSGTDNAQLLADRVEADHLLVAHQLLIGIAKFGPKAKHVRDVVAKKLNHRDQFARTSAALAITRIDSDPEMLRKEIKRLLKLPQSEQLGIDMAMELGDESVEFLNDFIPLTSSEDPIVRESVAIALGEMGPAAKSAWMRLEPLTRDEDPIVRYAAKDAIKKIKAKK